MFSDRHRDDAVLLDEIWDGIVGNKPAVTSPQQLLEAIRVLEAGAPMMSASQRERIRAKVQFPAATLRTSAAGITATLDAAPLPVSLPIARRRRSDHPILQIAATILLLLGIAGALFVTRTDDSDPRTTPVGAITSPMSQEQSPLDPLLYISVAAADTDRELVVIVRRIEIAPGGHWSAQIDEANQPNSDASLALSSGKVTATGTDGASTIYGQPGRIDVPVDGRLEITNTGESAALLIEFSMSPDGKGAEAVSPTDAVTANSSEMPTPYLVPTGYPATLYLWNPIGSAISQFVTPPTMELVYGLVERGSYSTGGVSAVPDTQASPTADGSIPQPSSLGPGNMISAPPGNFPDLRAESDDASILLVSARQVTVDDVARLGTFSEVSFSGENIQLDLRSITIQPGGRYSFRLTGTVIAWGLSGIGSIASDLSENESPITPNRYTSLFGSAEFSITARGDTPATFFLALVSQDAIEVIDSSQTTTSIAGAGAVSLPLGSYYLRVSIDASAGVEVNLSSQERALTLVSAGDAELTPLTELTLHTSEGVKTLAPFAGPIALSPGDWFITEPEDGYRLSRSEDTSQIARITLSPIVPPESSAQAQATPQSKNPEAVTAQECVVTPRSLDEYEQILTVPYADSDPAVNHQAGTGEITTDESIIEGVTNTMRQVIACNDPSTSYQGYSLYSESAIRYQASIGNLSLSDIESSAVEFGSTLNQRGPAAGQLLVNTVEVFPDGRAGAWVSAAAEIAYVTFVFEDGQWLINYWDDSSDSATPIP